MNSTGLTASGFTIILIGCIISYVATSLFTGCTVSVLGYIFQDTNYHYNASTNSITSNTSQTSTVTSKPILNDDGTTTIISTTTTMPVSSSQNLLTSLFLLLQLIVFCLLVIFIANYFTYFFSKSKARKRK